MGCGKDAEQGRSIGRGEARGERYGSSHVVNDFVYKSTNL